MIEEKDIIEIGKFQKTHGLRGELNAIIEFDEAGEDYVCGEGNPLIVEIDGIYVPFYVESIRPKGSTSFLIKLEGLDSADEAQEMVNKAVYAAKSRMDIDLESMMLESEFIGYRVIDTEFGDVGTVAGIDSTTVNELLEVDTPEGGVLFIPLVEEFISEIKPDAREVVVSIPESLLNLNRKED